MIRAHLEHASRLPVVRSLSTPVREPPPHASRSADRPPDHALPRHHERQQQREQPSTKPVEKKKGKEEKEKDNRKRRNEDIPYSVVRLVNPETGGLDPPARLQSILDRLDRKRQFLELVVREPEPIVKIFDSKLLYDRGRAKKLAQATNRPPEEKEVQLTWGVGAGDLQFKLRKVRAELEDGNRVNLVFAPKKGQKVPAPAEQERIVQEVLDLLADVGKERRARTVQKQIVAVFLENVRPKRTVELRWKYNDDADSWEGIKAVDSALRKGERVEAVFILPPPSKKGQKQDDDPSAANAVDRSLVEERVERTLTQLAEIGKESKPRDVRKAHIVAHLESFTPAS
ncbi:hypothetical protein BD413DRAFT_474401 [Trametes elegans]|nr:hypothetical protein BD413DRAFT_474401 [Trametes elegans]